MTEEQNARRPSGLRIDDNGAWARATLTARQSPGPHENLRLAARQLRLGAFGGSALAVWFSGSRRNTARTGRLRRFGQASFQAQWISPGPGLRLVCDCARRLGRSWVVGQLCANAFTPVQVFEDLVYQTEAEARARATSLRGNNPGLIRRDNHSDPAKHNDYEGILRQR